MGVPISNVTRRVVYAASGTGPYNFTFEILAVGDVAVYKDDALLTLTTDYTVTINSNGTGFITLVASPTGATQIAIVGNRTIQRTTDFVTGGDFFANTVNDEMDQQTIFAQQNAEGLQRALQAPQTDPTTIDMTLPRASVRANKTLAFDTDGNPTTGEVIGDNRGTWASGTAYNKRDIVKDSTNSNIYYANTSHTSTGSLPISTNADSGKWDLLVDAEAAGDAQNAAEAAQAAAETAETNAETAATAAASSASAAASSASAASSSASAASTSATNAASSASTASTAATNASNSATAAATSATNASNSASAASTSATNASNSATAASTSASNASTSATNAANSASAASTSASNASTSATNAANSATASASSATSAAASAAAAAASFDAFDDIYLGAKSSDPSVDNDGNALTVGDQYFNTTANELRVYNGSTWQAASTVGGTVTSLSVTGATTLGQNPTLSAGTANGVAYLNASKVLTTGSALTFDGTIFQNTNQIKVQTAAGTAPKFWIGQAATGAWSFGSPASQDALVWVNEQFGVETMRLTSTGLGIGTSTLQGKLTVQGDIYTRGGGVYYVQNGDNTNNYYLQNSGATGAANGNLNFVQGGVAVRATLDSSGNLGLGVTPSAWGDIKAVELANGVALGAYSAAAIPNMYLGANCFFNGSNWIYKVSSYRATRYLQASSGEHQWFNSASGTAGNAISFTQAMTLDASGLLALGTTSPASATRLTLDYPGFVQMVMRSSGTDRISLYGDASVSAVDAKANPLAFYAGSAERARIDSSGNLLVGTTSFNVGVVGTGINNSGYSYFTRSGSTNSDNTINVFSTGANAYRFYVGMGGTVFATSTSISAISDASLKENVRDLETGLPEVMALKPRRFDWKNGDAQNVAGFVAQEVEQVLPELVTDYVYSKDEEGNNIVKKSLKMGDILPTLVKAIQEQQALINAQQAALQTLTARVAALESN